MKSPLAVLVFGLAAMAGQDAGTASIIQGRVVRAGTNEPVVGVRVTGENTGNRVQSSATTDETGAFALTGLGPGSYRLTAVARGYVDNVYEHKSDAGPRTPVVVHLTPTGSVEGRVRDSNGAPAVGAPVALLRLTYDADGKKAFSSVATVDTDDRGQYRIFWITPGRYYLRAGGRVPFSLQTSARSPEGNQSQDPFGEVFYPGATSSEFAAPIEIRPGADLQGMDFRLQRQRLLRIRGSVIDTQTGGFPPGAIIGLLGEGFSSSGGNRYNQANGTFEIADLWPGAFEVVAVLRDSGTSSTQPGGRRVLPASDFMPVRLIDKDVEDVVLRLLHPGSLKGRVFIEGNASPAQGLNVRLQSLDGRLREPLPNTLIAPVNVDGSFEIPQIVGGNYQVGVSEAGYYVKQARYGGADVLNEPLKLGATATDPLDITLGRNLAQVSGTVSDTLLKPASGVRVVLVPDKGRYRRDLFKEATTDVQGRYALTNVPPGDYRVYAWESIEARAWLDPEVLKKFERDSKSVRLGESSSETADVRMIPVEAP